MKKYIFCLLAIIIVAASCGTGEDTQQTSAPEAKPVMTAGHKLFINNCIQCHNIKKDKIGPMLDGVMALWDNDTVRIRHFIRNSQESIHAGDPRAVAIYAKWNQTLMTPMPHLTDGDIDQILEYIALGED